MSLREHIEQTLRYSYDYDEWRAMRVAQAEKDRIKENARLKKANPVTQTDKLIQQVIDAGLLDLADAAIAALDSADDNCDMEAEEDGEGVTERIYLSVSCLCCGHVRRDEFVDIA